eukprot:234017_1
MKTYSQMNTTWNSMTKHIAASYRIEYESWITLNDTLSVARSGLRSIVHKDLIYVIGGKLNGEYRDEVDVIDTRTNSISLDSRLIRPVLSAGAVFVSDINKILLFGGYSGMNVQQAIVDNVDNTKISKMENNDIMKLIMMELQDMRNDVDFLKTEIGQMNKQQNDVLLQLQSMKNDGNEVYQWLNSIGLVLYYSRFVENGFDSLQFVKYIKDERHLEYIGIHNLGHKLHILQEIKRLEDSSQ